MGSLKGRGTKEERGARDDGRSKQGERDLCHATLAARKMEDDTFIRDGLGYPRKPVQVLHDALPT